MSKITKATFKAFLKKNESNLHIKYVSHFDGMTDSCETSEDQSFRPITPTTEHLEHTFGINGAWLVGGGRDYFREVNEDGFKGISVYNSCGSFVVGIPAQ